MDIISFTAFIIPAYCVMYRPLRCFIFTQFYRRNDQKLIQSELILLKSELQSIEYSRVIQLYQRRDFSKSVYKSQLEFQKYMERNNHEHVQSKQTSSPQNQNWK